MAAEKNFENKVKDFLQSQGCYFVKYWGGGPYTKAGIPDILACCQGRFFGVEVKARTGRPSILQLLNLERIRVAGGFGVLLYPDGFQGFKGLVTGGGSEWYQENIVFQEKWRERLDRD